MKKISFVTVLILIVSLAFATSYQIDFGTNENAVKLQENDYQKLSMNLTFDGIHSFEVESKKGTFNQIVIPSTYYVGEIGSPKLPALKKLIEIPFGAEVSVTVLDFTTTEYELSDFGIINPIIPVQPSHSKSIDDLTTVDFEYDEAQYLNDRFSNFELATVEVLGVMRGVRLARIDVAPVNYNPVTGKIKVYNNIDIEINFSGSDKELSNHIKASTYSPYFEAIYSKITNYRATRDEYPSHPDLTKYPVKYLIVADRIFEDELTDFIAWKTKKGFNVVEAYTDVIGSSASAIQTYVHAQYNAGTPTDPAPSFVLFVGDTDRVPASTTGSQSAKSTDLDYCSVDGDYFPEMYYGRMSAATEAQLTYQIDKILHYEKYEFTDPTYLDDVTLIAGADGTYNPTHGQPTINYGTDYYFNTAQGYANINVYLTSYTGCYDTVDEGLGFINYTAHCSETSWGTPALSQTAVRAFSNTGKYPLAIGNCCLAADFGYAECIGETWMRQENAGAVGYIGSSPSSYWDEDVYWSVGQFGYVGNTTTPIDRDDTTLGSYDAPSMSDYVAQDALVFVGDLAVTESGSSLTEYYWQAYNTLGDPSLVIYNTQGSVNTVNFNAILPIGATTFTVDAEEGSYVAISMGGVLHGTALVGATGSVDVPITAFTSAGTADIVVTKPQYQPVQTTVTVNALAGPFVSIDSYVISAGGDDIIEYGETVYLTTTLTNAGADTATNVNMTLTENDSYTTLTDAAESFGTIAAGTSVTRTTAYSFTVSNSVPDAHAFQLDGTITCTEDTWNDDMHFTAYAPILSIQSVAVVDGGNGRLDPGETANLEVTINNNGGANTNNINAILSSSDLYITINDNSDGLASLAAASSGVVTFTVTAPSNTPIGHTAAFDVAMTADQGYSTNDALSITIGLILEDFESGFTAFPWTQGGDGNWTVDTELPYEGTYCAKSGIIVDSQTSELLFREDFDSDGSISFYYKVSSEGSYDYLRFYIDNILQEQWSGTVAWTEGSYPVTAGIGVEFKWIYSKDSSVSSGSDCGWIDYVVLDKPGPADITITPLSFEKTLEPDESTSDVLTIGNVGEADLSYSARVSYVETENITSRNINENSSYGSKRISSNERKSLLGNQTTLYRDVVTIGAGSTVSTSTNDTPFGTYYHDNQNQYLFTASELFAAGMVAGTINSVGWNIVTADTQIMDGFNIELKHTTATSVTGFETGFSNCYSDTWTASTGWNDILFSTPFEWDGISNLLVKICFDNIAYTSNSSCYVDSYTDMNGWAYNDNTTGCTDPYEGTIDTRPQTRFDYTTGSGLSWLTLDGGNIFTNILITGLSDEIPVEFDATGLAIGDYEAEITITSNDPDESEIIIAVLLHVNDLENYPDWEVVAYPNNTATLYGTVSILGYDAEAGDLVGAFVDGECRGMGEIQIARAAYITMLINVAANGEMADFKVYDLSADTQYIANYTTEINIGETIGSYPDDLQPIDVLGILDVPQNVTIVTTSNETGVDVLISWSAVPGATSYTVYRSSDPDALFPGGWTAVTGISGTSWDYTTERDTRFYKVSANN